MAKSFKQMNKEELIKAAESLKLTEKVVESAKDPENITNAEYVTVLEAFKEAQDSVNSETKEEIEKNSSKNELGTDKESAKVDSAEPFKKVVDQHERAKLKQIKFKYIVTDHQNSVQIDDDDQTRTFPIQYGNLTTGIKNWNVGLHGNPQALPFSVVRKLEQTPMTVQTKNVKDEPIVKTQKRFRVTKVDGWTQDEIDQLKRTQNTRKFRD